MSTNKPTSKDLDTPETEHVSSSSKDRQSKHREKSKGHKSHRSRRDRDNKDDHGDIPELAAGKTFDEEYDEEDYSTESESGSESEESDDSVVDLSEDRIYQILSGVFETEKGHNVAEILYKIQKDVHVMATVMNQLIQLSLAAQQGSGAGDE